MAFHEGGHAVLAYVLPDADPVHKVTILPTGMALGVTQQLPIEERHIHPREYIEDSLCVRMGGRCAELLVYGDLSTGASNDLVGNTELARKMVREWGMSDEIGPMAWGSQGQVFLGEDLMHTRDYSEDTSQVIDDEVERILRAAGGSGPSTCSASTGAASTRWPARCSTRRPSTAPRSARLVDEAYGSPVHDEGAKSVPHFHEAAIIANGHGNGSLGDADGDLDADPVAVRASAVAQPAPAEGHVQADPAQWPPPPWPPAGDPPAGAPEGPATS